MSWWEARRHTAGLAKLKQLPQCCLAKTSIPILCELRFLSSVRRKSIFATKHTHHNRQIPCSFAMWWEISSKSHRNRAFFLYRLGVDFANRKIFFENVHSNTIFLFQHLGKDFVKLKQAKHRPDSVPFARNLSFLGDDFSESATNYRHNEQNATNR